MSGIGNISNSSGVGYQDLTGLGLTSSNQDAAQLDAAVSTSMSTDILNALAQFRAEGNYNPTSAEMEAKLSVVGAAAKQDDINQLQHLISGFQQALQGQTSANVGGGDPNNTTDYGYAFATITAGGSANISKYFGDTLGNDGNWGVQHVLDQLGIDHSSAAFAALGPANLPNGANSNAQISSIISQLQAKLSALQSQSPATVVDQTGATQMTAAQWLAKEMGVQSPHESYSLEQWGDIAQKLQINAAKKSSELNIGNGGGIQQVDGQYFVNGQEMSLSQINFCVRANQYQLIDQQIADQMNAVQQNNAKAQQAQAVLAAIQCYDGENINTVQTSTQGVGDMFDGFSGNSGWGVIQHYLSANFGVSGNTTPNYQNYENLMNGTNVATLKALTFSSLGSLALYNINQSGLTAGQLSTEKSANATDVTNALSHDLGITPANYANCVSWLAAHAPSVSIPSDASSWTASPDNYSPDTLVQQINQITGGTQPDAATLATMTQNLNGFFSTLKAADPTFYSSYVKDTNGGPPYSFSGTIGNSDYNDLKTQFGTYLQNNGNDNQVAQQKLDALNNARQAILDGMSAFTQGQAQSTGQIGTNL